MSRPAPSLVSGMRARLQRHAPFDRVREEHVEQLVAAGTLSYFQPGEVVLAPEDRAPVACHIVTQGRVRGERPGSDHGPSGRWELVEGEMFPLGALLAERPVTSVYRAVGDVFCLALPRADFDWLLDVSFVFRDFCSRRLTHLLELSRRQMQADYVAETASQQGMETPLGVLLRRAPVTCAPDTPVGDAARRMHAERVGSIIVVDDAQHPLGVLTRTDLVGKLLIAGAPMDAPAQALMSAPMHTLPSAASAGDAVLMMARHAIQHVGVTERGVLAGVVSERDLFGLQRLSLRQVSDAIRHAADDAQLVAAGQAIRELSRGLVAQGVGAAQLTRFISSLNDQLTVRALEQVQARHALPDVGWCWIAMGSEGRREQTISTDQDNGLILADDLPDAQAARAAFLAFARDVNLLLRDCGFPLCAGNIMASNPACCLSLAQWSRRFSDWIDSGDPQALLNASIFFDFRPLYGDQRLAYALRAKVGVWARANSRFLKQMANNALTNRPPLNWLDALLDGEREVDLKRHGAMPFVDAARILALAAGSDQTATVERLQAAAPALHLKPASVRAWIDAFQFVQLLRLRNQHRDDGDTPPPASANRVDPASLSAIDQRILKEAFRQARTLQQRLALNYPG